MVNFAEALSCFEAKWFGHKFKILQQQDVRAFYLCEIVEIFGTRSACLILDLTKS